MSKNTTGTEWSRRAALRLGVRAGAGTALLAAGGTRVWTRRSSAARPAAAAVLAALPTPDAAATAALPEAKVQAAAAPQQPKRPPTVQVVRDAEGRAIVGVKTTRPWVTLTVDDGWARRADIMQVLLRANVPAVFFLTAQAVARDEAFLRAAVDNGFEIGNHTTTHRNLSGLTRPSIEAELAGMDEVYRRAVGTEPAMRFFRAPYGALTPAVLDAADARSYQAVQWNVSTRDWANLDGSGVVGSVVDNVRPGSIVLSHFNARCLDALPQIITRVRANGLEFVSLSQLTANA